MSQIVRNTVEKAKEEDTRYSEEQKGDDEETKEGKRGMKRKECPDDEGDKGKETAQSPYGLVNFKKAKNVSSYDVYTMICLVSDEDRYD